MDSCLFFLWLLSSFQPQGASAPSRDRGLLSLNETGRRMPLAVTYSTAVPPASWSLEPWRAEQSLGHIGRGIQGPGLPEVDGIGVRGF